VSEEVCTDNEDDPDVGPFCSAALVSKTTVAAPELAIEEPTGSVTRTTPPTAGVLVLTTETAWLGTEFISTELGEILAGTIVCPNVNVMVLEPAAAPPTIFPVEDVVKSMVYAAPDAFITAGFAVTELTVTDVASPVIAYAVEVTGTWSLLVFIVTL
jgi:hypothetical protein